MNETTPNNPATITWRSPDAPSLAASVDALEEVLLHPPPARAWENHGAMHDWLDEAYEGLDDMQAEFLPSMRDADQSETEIVIRTPFGESRVVFDVAARRWTVHATELAHSPVQRLARFAHGMAKYDGGPVGT